MGLDLLSGIGASGLSALGSENGSMAKHFFNYFMGVSERRISTGFPLSFQTFEIWIQIIKIFTIWKKNTYFRTTWPSVNNLMNI